MRIRAGAVGLILCGVLGPAGCGGDDAQPKAGTQSARPALVSQPRPRNPIAAERGPFGRAIATQSCRRFEPLRFSLIRLRPPGSPATGAECPDPGLPPLRGRRIDSAGQFGTGAVMEGPGARGGRAWTVWALDGDGRFRYVGIEGRGKAQLGTPFGKRSEAASVVSRFLTAVRARDCPAMQRLFSPRGSRLVTSLGGTGPACRAVLRGRFFAPAVRSTPGARPRMLGGTRNLAFFGLATRHTYFTLLLGNLASPAVRVLDVLPNTAVDLSRR